MISIQLFFFLLLAFGCFIGTSIADSPITCSSAINTQYSYLTSINSYFWNKCASVGKKYFSQDLTKPINAIPPNLAECFTFTSINVREDCEADYDLSNQPELIADIYECYLDYYTDKQTELSSTTTCDTQLNFCDYMNTKNGSTATVLALNPLKNSNFVTFQTDLNLGLQSNKCPDISTNCSTLTNQWQSICVQYYQQQCMDKYLTTNVPRDLSVVAYQCLQKAIMSSLLSKFSLLVLLALTITF